MLNPDHSTIKFTPRKSDDYASSSSSSKLSKAAKGDFERILGDSDREHEDSTHHKKIKNELDEEIALEENVKAAPKAVPPSLFDLSKETNRLNPKGEEIAKVETTEQPSKLDPTSKLDPVSKPEPAIESPSALFQRMSKEKGLPLDDKIVSNNEYPNANLEGVTHKDLAKKGEVSSEFHQEQADLSYVNQMAFIPPLQQTTPLTEVQVEKPQPVVQKNLQELINQLVESIKVVKTAEKTDTIVTLKHPPMFEGANLIVTTADKIKGEFNIRFENLSDVAKQVLDLQQNRQSLVTALEQKGYVIHIVTTTQIETPIIAQEGRFQRGDEERRGQQQKFSGEREEREQTR